MDTRVGPIEHSQMDPTEGSSEGGIRRPTVPWRPFRAFPDGHQGRPIEHSQIIESNGPHRKKQEHKTHNGMCTGSHFQAFLSFSRVLSYGKSESFKLGRGQIVHRTALRYKMAKTTEKRNGQQGNWDEEATESAEKIPNKMQERG